MAPLRNQHPFSYTAIQPHAACSTTSPTFEATNIFLRRLPGFELIYAAPSPTKFDRAEHFFRGTFEETSAANARSVARYFRLRRLWEEEKHGLLTRADRDFLRRGNQRYRDEFWESAYRKWADGNPGSVLLDAFLTAERQPQTGLSEPIFCLISTRSFRPDQPNEVAPIRPKSVLHPVLNPVRQRSQRKYL